MRRNQGKPGNVTRDEFNKNWDLIFNKKRRIKMPRKKTTTKRKSTVNKAGNYTKPTMRKRLFERIKAGSKGGKPGQWSARKAQLLAKQYKAKGGGYK
jgi:hypothetical protein